MRLGDNVKKPLVILLIILGAISYLTGDVRATIFILTMVVMGIVLRYVQEYSADNAAERLKAMVHTTTSVLRDGKLREISLKELDLVISYGTPLAGTLGFVPLPLLY